MERLRAFWQRGWLGKVVLSAAGLFGVLMACCVLLVLFVPRSPQTAASAPTALVQAAAAPQPTEAPTAAPAPTVAPKPTATPAPTDTPAPTATPAPTDTPTAVPSPTPLPEPIALKGHGKVVTDPFTPPYPINRVVFEHKGKRNFIITAYTKDGQQDLLVNTIGDYHGERPLISDQEVYFEVNADGDWTATVKPIGQNDAYATGFDGQGDLVSDLFMPTSQGAVPFAFTHDGKRNFVVQLHCAGGDDLVANEIGATEGQVVVRFRKGPCLWEVQADGKWSVKPK